MNCDQEQIGYVVVIVLVVILIMIPSCIPPEWHHPAEKRPASPPESLYE